MQVYDLSGKSTETLKLDLPEKRELSPKAYACAVKVLRQNWRQGTVACKGRGEVSFSNKKPWKQKGTGRARAGSRRSPIWRSGGIIFGPQARVRTLKMPKGQRSLVFNNILHELYENGNVHCLDFDIPKTPNTKAAYSALKAIGCEKKKVVLFVDPANDVAAYSFRNMANVRTIAFDEPDAFNLTHSDCWIVLKKDVGLFKDMVSKWN